MHFRQTVLEQMEHLAAQRKERREKRLFKHEKQTTPFLKSFLSSLVPAIQSSSAAVTDFRIFRICVIERPSSCNGSSSKLLSS